ncbi:MAG: hypothetical protein WHS63_01630 [Tenuifilum sp.]|uniref:hypothetical protein n=1 Tax=Tenuifilum sp. TaxID=2760880 RepID=UPI0030AD059B
MEPVRLEVLVASPPTKKCKAIISMFERFLSEFPGKLKLDIYFAGEPMTGTPTEGFRKESGKIRKIPSAYVNGINVASKEVPDEEIVRQAIVKVLNNP